MAQPVSSRAVPAPKPPAPAFWASAATDADAFAREQAALGQLWTFLGCAADIARDGDWFRTRLGGRSIFVQRFGAEIRGFENRCAHRFYPLRTARRGNGPVVCGFHHWRYNKDGLALGIPVCDEAYGVAPRTLGARLQPVEIATCGGLLFGRFPSEAQRESLPDFLGDTVPLVETFCPAGVSGHAVSGEVQANWKFLTHISLDDYHIVAVHPSTFGRHGYLKRASVTYARMGLHSLFTTEEGDDPAGRILAACRAGTYRPVDYVIVNLFPSLGISQFHAVDLFGRSYFFLLAFRYVPLAPGLSRMEGWILPAPGSAPRPGVVGALDRFVHAVASRVVRHYVRRVQAEDHAVCEGLQSAAGEMDAAQRLSPACESRIGWFEEAYASVVGGAPAGGRR